MKRYAVVDIGTNSVRLMIAEAEGGQVRAVRKALNTVRIGEGIGVDSGISPAAMTRAIDALCQYKEEALRAKAEEIYFFATSAVREAANREEFTYMAEKALGLPLDIISGDEEAKTGFIGAVGAGNRRGLIDIGGGSTEIMFGRNEDLEYVKSFKVGVVRALSLYPDSEHDGGSSYEKLRTRVREEVRDLSGRGFGAEKFVGIGGTATALASIALGLTVYDSDRVQGYSLTVDKLDEIFVLLTSVSLGHRRHVTGLDAKRADVIVFGCCILQEFISVIGIDSIEASDRDNLEGYLLRKLKSAVKKR